jgi:putative transposase
LSWATSVGFDDESGEPRNWGDHGSVDSHRWAFSRFTTLLNDKTEAEGIDVELPPERDTSKLCSACGHTDDNQRVERVRYVCETCDTVANADVNGAENTRQKVLPSLATGDGDRDTGWLAQPAVRLFGRSEGVFAPRKQVVNHEP